MNLIVKKFGGSSVATIERIKAIAAHLAEEKKKNVNMVVVVSAMSKTTDQLISLAKEITPKPNARELDMLLTAGERVTMSLLSLALHELGISSISFTGSQSGIITNSSHGNARIQTVNAFRIKEELDKGKLVIVAGFQGVSREKEITTLGRGGSDTSAIALSCYLKASKCEIYTDVDAVYSADPHVVSTAQAHKRISYEQMLYLGYKGSSVLQPRAIEFAYKYKIAVEVKSSFTFKEGTMIENMETNQIKAIAHKENLLMVEVKCSCEDIPYLLKSLKTNIYDYYIHLCNFTFLIEESELDSLKADIFDFYLKRSDINLSDKEIRVESLKIDIEVQKIFESPIRFTSIALTGYSLAYDNEFAKLSI